MRKMEDKAKQQLDVLKRQHGDLSREMDMLRTEEAKIHARMGEVSTMLAAVHGGIVALESILPTGPQPETVIQPAVG
jgi:prefoldin subunit 5